MPVAFSDASDRVSNNQDEAGPSSSKEQPRKGAQATQPRPEMKREGTMRQLTRKRSPAKVRQVPQALTEAQASAAKARAAVAAATLQGFGVVRRESRDLDSLKHESDTDHHAISSVSFLIENIPHAELRGVVLPWSQFRIGWDLVGFCFIAYTSIALPVQVSFLIEEDSPLGIFAFELAMDIFFLADIVLNCRTAFVKNSSTLVYKRRDIVRHYLATWFAVDFTSSIPWELILLLAQTGDKGLSALKVLKLPKMLRLTRVVRKFMTLRHTGILSKIAILLLGIGLLVHWLCAAWYVIVTRCGGNWLEFQLRAPPGGVSVSELHAFYFYSTMMMVMADSTGPTNQIEVAFTVCCLLFGACVNAIVFANVAWLVSQMSAANVFHAQRMTNVDTAMVFAATRTWNDDGRARGRMSRISSSTLCPRQERVGVKSKIAARVRAYYDYRWQCHKDHEVDEFVATLPAQLRSDVSCLMHWRLIRRCPLFTSADRRLISAIATALQPEVYLPSEFILVAGNFSSCMFFIAKGRVLVVERKVHTAPPRALHSPPAQPRVQHTYNSLPPHPPGQIEASEIGAVQQLDNTDDGGLEAYAKKSLEAAPEPSSSAKLKSKWKSAASRVASGVREDYFGAPAPPMEPPPFALASTYHSLPPLPRHQASAASFRLRSRSPSRPSLGCSTSTPRRARSRTSTCTSCSAPAWMRS